MKKTVLLLLIALAGRSAATPVDSLEARNVAVNFHAALHPGRETLKIRNSYTAIREGLVTRYVYVFENNDFVMVAANDAVFPVLAYSREQSFGGADFSPDLDWWLNIEYDRRIVEAHHKGSVNPAMRAVWDDILYRGQFPLKSESGVLPLVSSRWGQSRTNDHQCPGYNNKVPMPSLGCYCTKCTAGCVAVAMAQIMNYWKFPASNEERVFDWCHMPDRLIKFDGIVLRPDFSVECDAIAGLLVNCGHTANLTYCVSNCATGSTLGQAASAFQNEYSYKSSLQHRYRTVTTNWKEKLRTNLEAGMPVLYGGQSGSGGHAFVCDGYEGDVFFHFNWGWTGSYDGFFYISDNDGEPEIEYDELQEALFNIEPGEVSVVDCNPCDDVLNISNTLSDELFNPDLPNLVWSGLASEYNFNPDLNPVLPVASTLIQQAGMPRLLYDEIRSGTVNLQSVVIPDRVSLELTAYREINFVELETLPGAELSAEIRNCPDDGRRSDMIETPIESSWVGDSTNSDLQLWPNPAHDFLYVAFSAEEVGKARLILRDESGIRVREYSETISKIGPCRFRIPVGHLTPGHYFLEIRTNRGFRVGKVVLG